MKNKKSKKVRSFGSLSYWLFNIMLFAIVLGAVLLSVFGKGDARLPLDADYRNVIGVSSQVITAIVSFVVSIIGIAISLHTAVANGHGCGAQRPLCGLTATPI